MKNFLKKPLMFLVISLDEVSAFLFNFVGMTIKFDYGNYIRYIKT